MSKAAIDPAGVIGQAVDAYKRHAGVLLPLAFAVFAIQLAVGLVLTGNLVGNLVTGILTGVLTYLFQGIVVEVARDVEDGVLDSSIGQLIAAVVPVILPVFVVSVLTTIAWAFGMLLFVIPGLIVATYLAVVIPVTVLERPGIVAAFGRSIDLVKGNGLPVFGLIFFNFVLSTIPRAITGNDGSVTGGVIGWVVAAIVAPLTGLIVAMAYLRLREAGGEPPLPTGVATADGPEARPGV